MLVSASAALVPGCADRPSSLDKPVPPAFAGANLTYEITPRFPHPELVEQRLKAFATRTGAHFETAEGPDADLHFFAAAELPRLVEQKRLLPVSEAFRSPDAPYDWNDLTQPYAARLSLWNGVPMGVPLLGEGQVLVHRIERFADADWLRVFRAKTGRELGVPQTWDELADWASFFAAPGRPSLPPLPAADADLERLFYDIAVCYDRRTRAGSDVGANIPTADEGEVLLAFQYDLQTYQPRIAKPAFVHALQLLKRMAACTPEGTGDPVSALESNAALFAVLKLDELARLKGTGFGIAPLPGSAFTFDYRTDLKIADKGGINRMPYLGWGSALGGVGINCTRPEAAFDFLADFAHPTKGSVDAIAAARYGAGPFRRSHEETRNLARWFSYGLDKPNTDQLLAALHDQGGTTILNYRMVLRVPDEAAHTAILVDEIRRALRGTVEPESALNSARRRWMELDRKPSEEVRRAWIRHSLGL